MSYDDAIDTGFIEILPDFTRFRAEWLGQLRQATMPDHIDIKLDLDTAELKAAYARDMAELKSQFQRVRSPDEQVQRAREQATADSLRRQEQMDRAHQQALQVSFRDTLSRQNQDHITALAEKVRRERDADNEIVRQARKAHDEYLAERKTKAEVKRILANTTGGGSGSGDSSGGDGDGGGNDFLGNVSTLLSGGRAFQKAQAGLVGAGLLNIAPLTGAVVGLASAFAIAGTASAAFGLAATGHMTQLTTVMDDIKTKGVQLADLPAPFQTLIPEIQHFQGAWQEFLTTTRVPVFDVFGRGLSVAERGLDKFAPLVNSVAGSIRDAVDEIGRFADGPAVTGFLQTVQERAPQAIASLTASAENLGGGLLDVLTGFAPAGQSMLDMLAQLTGKFSTWAAGLKGSPDFQNFLDRMIQDGPKVLDVLGNLVVVAAHLIEAMTPLGMVAIEVLDDITGFLAAIDPGVLATFITVAAATVVTLKTFAILTTIKDALTGFLLVLGLGGGAVSTFKAALVGLRTALAELTVSELVTGIGALVVGIGVVVAALYSWSHAGKDSAEQIAQHKSIVDLLSDSLRENNGLLDENAKKQIAVRLADRGITTNPNVDPQRALSGALGNKSDYTETIDTLDKLAKAKDKAYSQAVLVDRGHGTNPEISVLKKAADQAHEIADAYRAYGGAADTAQTKQDAYLRSFGLMPGAVGATGAAFRDAAQDLATFQSALKADHNPIIDVVKTTFEALKKAKESLSASQLNEAKVAQDTDHARVMATRALSDARERQAEVAKTTAQANIDAARRVEDAEYSYAQSATATQKAVKALADARKAATQDLQDQADKEESAAIALERARRAAYARGQYSGPLSTETSLRNREVVVALDEAEKNVARLHETGTKLKSQGVEGAPAVVSARENVEQTAHAAMKAEQSLSDARRQQGETFVSGSKAQRDAQRAVNDAIDAQTKAFNDGAAARDAAHKATMDQIDAEKLAQGEYDNSAKAIAAIGGAYHIAGQARDGLAAKLKDALSVNMGDVPAKLQDVRIYLESLRLAASDSNYTADSSWEQASNTVNAAGSKIQMGQAQPGSGALGQHVSPQNRATGGPITGAGTTLSDSIRAVGPIPGVDYYLSHDEHIWAADEVAAVGGHANVERIRAAAKSGAIRFSGGGRVLDISKFDLGDLVTKPPGIIDKALTAYGFSALGAAPGGAVGSAINAVQSWLQTVDPLPYVMGGVGPAAYDCSGLVGEVWARLTGNPDYKRYFSTGGEKEFLERHGFQKGSGTFTVGFSGEHTMGNLAGLNFEAANSRSGIHVGSATSDVLGFPNVYHLPTLGNAFVGSGGGNAIQIPPIFQFPGGLYARPGRGSVNGTGAGGDLGLPDSVSADVARIAAATGREMGADRKAMLAMFEAGIVESGMRNLTYGDRDSQGFLQQRPSQGWGTVDQVRNVAHAAREFLTRAMAREGHYATPGRLAQAVQVSAFPDRYDARENAAKSLLSQYGFARGGPVLDSIIADSGAVLPPHSATVVHNNTSDFEKVGFGMTSSEMRQLALLIAQALGTQPAQLRLSDETVIAEKVVRPAVEAMLSTAGMRR